MNRLDIETLLPLEHAGWESLCARTGATFYGGLMRADALMVLVNGMVLDRDQVIASLNQAPGWDSYEITQPRLVTLTPDAAILTYTAHARRGDEPPFEALMSSTYVLENDEPRLAFYQQTTATH